MTPSTLPIPREQIRRAVAECVRSVTVTDMHTHLFAPEFGSLNLWGIDSLLTYHYLIAEFFRIVPMPYEDFWRLNEAQQANLIWKALFVDRPPISEAAQGVVRVLAGLGLDPLAPDLQEARSYFAEQDPAQYANKVLDMAGVDVVVMTNDPFDPAEAAVWRAGGPDNPRYKAALRLDHLLIRWPEACAVMQREGCSVTQDMSGKTLPEVRRFLDRWIALMEPLYLAVSLPASFAYPDGGFLTRLLREAVLPTCREHALPMGLMIGVRRQVNPHLRLAGDGVGRADVTALERVASEFPDVRFLVTLLSRENQHELCVCARKFGNILPFGCWWFLNNPSIVAEITRERLEMLGATFVAQHSDARVLDQLLYKWPVSRRIIGDVLAETYEALLDAGRPVTEEDIAGDANRLLRSNFREWVKP
jgi:hypothetical protein